MRRKSLDEIVKGLPGLDNLPEDIRNIWITGIAFDSRKVQPGNLFIPLTGVGQDGHVFIPDAIKKGAIAVIGSQACSISGIPYFQVENTRLTLALVSAAFFDHPARKLNVIGVTGTDGKTTTCNLLYSILKHAGIRVGIISTVNAIIGDQILDTGFHVTTPDAPDVQRYLALMVEAGLTHVILEVTSHGLAQDRVAGCEFDIGVVTNVTHEHFDFHKDYDQYLAAKGKLFEFLSHTSKKTNPIQALAVLNKDDNSYDYLSKISKVKRISYSLVDKTDFYATNICETKKGIKFSVNFENQNYKIETCLIGKYNVANCLAAFSTCIEGLRIIPELVIEGILCMPGVPGRYEIINLGQQFEAVVDFAHTPNALREVLSQAKRRTKGKIIAVFGSAGLRDREKRRLMAETSTDLADITILTAEDPRTELLQNILDEMADAGMRKGAILGKNLWIIPDRGSAIRKAVKLAGDGDIVIACGKGHEQSMCFGETEYFWDDRIALKAALAELLDIQGEKMPFLPTTEQ